MKEELQSFKNKLAEELAFFAKINSLKSDALTTDALTDKKSSEYLREENREKTLIIKQPTEIKTTVSPKNTVVTYNEDSKDKTTQNTDGVRDKTIQNNNEELFKNKNNTSKNLANMKTLSTTDIIASTYFEHPKNEKIASANEKSTS